MSLFRRRPVKTYEEAYAEAVVTVARETEASRVEEQSILSSIGEITDPLAKDTLGFLDRLPQDERLEFVQNVFRRLVVQSLYTTKSLDSDHIGSLPYATINRYGTGSVCIDLNGDLSRAVVEESLPQYDQPELGI